MTTADRIADVLVEQGPMPVCVIATSVRKQKAEVIAALNANPDRFVHNGLKARASRWDVRPECERVVEVGWPDGFDDAEDALCELVRQRLRTPWEALLLVVDVVNGAA